jgi:ABC-type bacteriocin/lantibiotic exporter with double-glycine peptidase domain
MTRFLFTLLSTMLISGEELRFTYAQKQGYDTSCGVAVTASLLNTYWNTPINEVDLYQDMILDRLAETGGNEVSDTNYTISFLIMTDYLKQHRIAARAYKMDFSTLADSLQKGYAPIVVNYTEPQPHFALLLHINERGFAFVADPARGFEFVDSDTFNKNYSGNALLTASNGVPPKNSEYVQAVIATEERRLDRLEELATSRRLRGGQ